MRTDCISPKLSFPPLGARRVDADFEAGRVTVNAGLLVVAQPASKVRLFERAAACFDDKRAEWRTEHPVRDLVAQRVLGLVAGYEDLNDHDQLRADPALAAAVGKRYVFCGEHLLAATLRTADRDGASGALETLQCLVKQIREVRPSTRIIVRGDSGFCRDPLLTWCEAQFGVEYIVGLARNSRLAPHVDTHRRELTAEVEKTGKPARRLEDFRYRTKTSWSTDRRVVGYPSKCGAPWSRSSG